MVVAVAVAVIVSVSMSVRMSVRMPVPVMMMSTHGEHAKQIDTQTHPTDNEQLCGVVHLWRFDDPLDRLKDNKDNSKYQSSISLIDTRPNCTRKNASKRKSEKKGVARCYE